MCLLSFQIRDKIVSLVAVLLPPCSCCAKNQCQRTSCFKVNGVAGNSLNGMLHNL